MRTALTALLSVVLGAGGACLVAGCQLPPNLVVDAGLVAGPAPARFPATAPWSTDVTAAPVAADSAASIAALVAAGGFGGGLSLDLGLYTLVAQPADRRRVFMARPDLPPGCDSAPVPIPAYGRVEGSSDYLCRGGACRLLIVDGGRLFELERASIVSGRASGTAFSGGCLAVWSLGEDVWNTGATYGRGEQCSGADVSGMPIAPLLVYRQELAAGDVAHALRLRLPADRVRSAVYVHPATHAASAATGTALPLGARLRLRASVELSQLSAMAQLVARALQQYGAVLAELGEPAVSVDGSALGLLGSGSIATLAPDDFEIVEGGAALPGGDACARSPVTQ